MVEQEGVAVRILEEGHVADAGVKGVRERNAARLERGARGLDVLDVQRDRRPVGVKLAADRLGVDQLPREAAGLELAPGTRSYTAEQRRPSTLP